jgi:transmembrane sensor
MTTRSGNDDTEARRLVEAAAWRAHLTETGAETSLDFEAWLAMDPRNEAAWRQVQAPWDFLGEQANAPEVLELRRAALREARDVSRRRWFRSAFPPGVVRRALIAASVLAAFGVLFVWNLSRPTVYSTAAGERRLITLADGSQVCLDARSEVQVRYTEHARDLTLTAGQARFDVAHDAERPFRVTAGGQRVVATGTAFNVDLLGSHVMVTLIEGRVLVLPREAPASTKSTVAHSLASDPAAKRAVATESGRALPGGVADTVTTQPRLAMIGGGVELTAGEQLIVAPEMPPSIVPVSIERATAWQNGRLVFENEPLSMVVLRVSRYSGRPLRVGDERVSGLRISGVFNTGDVEGFITTVTAYLPVDAQSAPDGAIELRHRET